ncbi:MAG: DUF4124 domain-containing protein [Desulfuromonadales bacterium]|nr:DUF4124 domain-containing protein [Desulfuromonadales bacterium]
MKTSRCLIIALSVALLPAFAHADLYQWTDDSGVVNYTDNPSSIPAKYKKRVSKQADIDNSTDNSDATATNGAPDSSAQNQMPPKTQKKTLYGGKEGTAWQVDFANAKAAVSSIEDEKSNLQERMTDKSISRIDYLLAQSSLKDANFRLSKAKDKLDALNTAADNANLPAEFR